MKTLPELFEAAAKSTQACVAVAVAEDANMLEAIGIAWEQGIANFILVGNEGKIRSIAEILLLNLSPFEIINEPDPFLACQKAVSLVAKGRATALMKGLVDTSVIMKVALDKEKGIRKSRKLTHLAIFELPTYHKLLFVTDAAINIAPDLDTKQDIIQNAADGLNNLGIQNPKIALLAAKEKVDERMPVTVEYAKLVKRANKGFISGCIVDGPLALDNAVSLESAQIKNIASEVAGDADILVCPDIEAGNILYKSLAFLANGRNGGVVLGAKQPIILTSRADSSDSKLISIALGVLF